MAGILASIKLRERGIECIVFEKADRVGGTWRDNSYPGLACDVPAHWYTYSFARNPAWDRLLAEGKELLAYFEGVARDRSEEHTSELQSLMRISYAVFCLKKKNHTSYQYSNKITHDTNVNIYFYHIQH